MKERKHFKFADFVGKNLEVNDNNEVIAGKFNCSYCGAIIEHENLYDHFERCFKEDLKEWEKKHHPSFEILGWDLASVYDNKTKELNVILAPDIKKVSKDITESSDMPMKLINSNIGKKRLSEVITEFCEKHNLSFEAIHIKPNKQGNYAVFYQEHE